MESIKMKNTLLASALLASALLALVASTSASASMKSYTFEAIDNAPETQVCITAAQEGITSAKETAKELGVNFNDFRNGTTCNKLSITKFVKKFATPKVETFAEVVKKDAKVMVAKDAEDMASSNQCLQAALGGEIMNKTLVCNGINIETFARKMNKEYNILVSSI